MIESAKARTDPLKGISEPSSPCDVLNLTKLGEARAQLAVAESARDAEQEKLRNQTEAYTQQTILLSDLLQEQALRATTEDQYRQALLAFWTTRADFERALGEE